MLAYAACAETLQLPRLRAGLASYLSRPGVWRALCTAPEHAGLLRTLQQRHPGLHADCRKQASGGGRARDAAAVGSASRDV